MRFLSLLFLISSISAQNSSSDYGIIRQVINSKEFNSHFGICGRVEDEVIIYKIAPIEFPQFKTDCKIISFAEIDFKIDVNSSMLETKSRLVLYNFEKNECDFEIRFLDTYNNSFLILTCNPDGRITELTKGNF